MCGRVGFILKLQSQDSGPCCEDIFQERIESRWPEEPKLDEEVPSWAEEVEEQEIQSNGQKPKGPAPPKPPDLQKYLVGDTLVSLDPHVVLCWLRKALIYQSLSAQAHKEFHQANWWQTVNNAILPKLREANYLEARDFRASSGLSVENGLVFARISGSHSLGKFGPPAPLSWSSSPSARL